MPDMITVISVTNGKELESFRLEAGISRKSFDKLLRPILGKEDPLPHTTRVREVEDGNKPVPASWVAKLPEILSIWRQRTQYQAAPQPIKAEVKPIERPSDAEVQAERLLQEEAVLASQVKITIDYHLMKSPLPEPYVMGLMKLILSGNLTIANQVIDDLMQGRLNLSQAQILRVLDLLE